MKKVWISALVQDKEKAGALMGVVRQYGLEGNGHFWTDDLKNMAWLSVRDEVLDQEVALWVIMTSQKDLEADSVRFALALVAIALQAAKGVNFPILFVDTGEGLDIDSMPTPLIAADSIAFDSPSLVAKMVAKANTPVKPLEIDYRLGIHANTGFGLWFEVGPSSGQTWNGALLGACGGEIDFHGVGPAGKLPQKAVLEYPMEGLKLQLADKEYVAWAVKNVLEGDASYYVRLKERAESIVFGPFSEDEESSVHVARLS